MKTILIDAGLGITIFNLPDQVLGLMVGNHRTNDNGELVISVSENDVHAVTSMIQEKATSMHMVEHVEAVSCGDIISIRPRVTTGLTWGHLTPEEVRLANEDNDDQDYDQDDDQDMDDEEVTEEVTEGVNAGVVLPSLTQDQNILNDDQALAMIAGTLENELSNLGRNLHDKVNEYSILWSRAIKLKREIDEIRSPIQDNPIISNLISQVNDLRSADNMIDEIFFVDGFIIARTKQIVTDNQIEGSKRLIGRMEIKLNLKQISGNAQVRNVITLRNMDRRYYDGHRFWECAHAPSDNSVCWGSGWEQLFNAILSRELPAIIEVIIKFIKNPNPTDIWGSHIKYWPAFETQEVN